MGDFFHFITEHTISNSGVIEYDISDHFPIYLIKKKIRSNIRKTNASGRSYLHYNREAFNRHFDSLDWGMFENNTDPSLLWDYFISNIVRVLDLMCPIKTLQVVDKKPEWLTNDLLIQMRQRDKAFRKARRTGSQMDWDYPRRLRNRLGMDIKSARANTIRAKLERHGDNPKRFWQEINKLLPHQQDSGIRSLHVENTNTMVEDMKLNDHINEYFAGIGYKLTGECTPGVNENVNNVMLNGNVNVVNFDRSPFTLEEISKVCNEINICKSASIENVKTMVLKNVFVDYIERIAKIFNNCLVHSVFPSKWKLSTIVPLPKVSCPNTASELRPVALTPLPGKLMEKLVCKRLQSWISDNNLLSDRQHGFRKGRSTVSAIAALLDELYRNINKNKNSFIIYLDLKKAFDTISHTKLIFKLGTLGLDALTIEWFNSYLTGRSQCVKLNNLTSDTLPVTYGVPQGSILGPVLFSIYINDISDIVNCGMVLYANDTVIFHSDKNILQHNLKLIANWCNDNLLTINVKKSHWMKTKVCARNEQEPGPEIVSFKVKDTYLAEVDLYKYLGLHISSTS